MTWDTDRIQEAAAAWVWVPPEAQEVRTEEYHLLAYPPALHIPTQVAWCRSSREPAELVDEVVARVRAWGRPEVSFWVSDRTRPPGLHAHLRDRGAVHAESVDLLAWDLAGPLPSASSFAGEVRPVTDEESLRSAYEVAVEVWGQDPPEPVEVERELAELTAPGATTLRVVAVLGGEPAATGGATLAEEGEVLRLWGAATRARFRGRGAYHAVLAHRLALGRERGASTALVKAVTTTSSPILRHLGFEVHGQEHRLVLTL